MAEETRYRKNAALQLVDDLKTFEDNIDFIADRSLADVQNESRWMDRKYNVFLEDTHSVMEGVVDSIFVIRNYREQLQDKIRQLR